MSSRRPAKGFTLIELMIVVAIIGILAAIAIPNFLKYQLRAKFGELPFNVNAMFKAEESVRQSERPISVNGVTTTGQYVSTGRLPSSCTAGTSKNPWAAGDLAAASNIDWTIEGPTYGCYEALASQGGAAVTVASESDIDGDSSRSCVAIFHPVVDMAGGGLTTTNPTETSTVCGGVGGYAAGAPYGVPRRFPDDGTF